MQTNPGADVRRRLVQHHISLARAAWSQQAGSLGNDLVILVLGLDDPVAAQLARDAGYVAQQVDRHRQAGTTNGFVAAAVIAVRRQQAMLAFADLDHPSIAAELASQPQAGKVRLIVVAAGGASLAVVDLRGAAGSLN